jgi:hypothetical protein
MNTAKTLVVGRGGTGPAGCRAAGRGAAGCLAAERRLGAVASAMEVVERGLAGLAPLAPVPATRSVAGVAMSEARSELIGVAFAVPVAVACPGSAMATEDGDHDQPEHDDQDEDRHEEADHVTGPESPAVGPGRGGGARPRTGRVARAVGAGCE